MSLPSSLGAYRDCQDLFERALTDAKGVRACLGTYAACFQKRQRMHYFRNLDRVANKAIYAGDHPMHGTSAYDDFILQIIPDEDKQWWLYVQPRSAQVLHVEGLSEVPDLLDAEATEVHALEDHSDGQ